MSNPTHHRLVTDQAGQTMAEYSVLLSAIALVVAVAFPAVGSGIGGLYSAVAQVFGA
jgi:Flp pilus assembly pilin Flp